MDDIAAAETTATAPAPPVMPPEAAVVGAGAVAALVAAEDGLVEEEGELAAGMQSLELETNLVPTSAGASSAAASSAAASSSADAASSGGAGPSGATRVASEGALAHSMQNFEPDLVPTSAGVSSSSGAASSSGAGNSSGAGPSVTTDAGCSGDGDEACSICRELAPPLSRATVPACGHVFCASCIVSWGSVRAACALCRAPFQSLLVHRSLDGTPLATPALESVQLLLRTAWVGARSVTPGPLWAPPPADAALAAAMSAARLSEPRAAAVAASAGAAAPYFVDERLEDAFEELVWAREDKYSALEDGLWDGGGRGRALGNRPFGPNGFMSAGRRRARAPRQVGPSRSTETPQTTAAESSQTPARKQAPTRRKKKVKKKSRAGVAAAKAAAAAQTAAEAGDASSADAGVEQAVQG